MSFDPRLLLLVAFLFLHSCVPGCAPDMVWPTRPITAPLDGAAPTDVQAQDTSPDAAPEPSLEASVDAPADLPPPQDATPFPWDVPDPRDQPRIPEAGSRTTFPPLRVFVSTTWTADQRRGVWAGIILLQPLVPQVVESSDIEADLLISPATSPDCNMDAADTFTRTAYADPRCFPTASGFDFPHAIAHLVLHHLGLRHVCVGPGESATDCSTVPFGRGIMNAHFAEQRTPARTRLGWTEGLSAFDLAEANRVFTREPWRFP